MDCPNNNLLLDYNNGELSSVERMIIRDHLVVCPACRTRLNTVKLLENALKEPVFLDPPADLEKNVMKMLFPRTPSRISLAVLLGLSFSLFVALLYVSFDVANNGVLTALQLSSSDTTSLLGSLIRLITSSFKIIYAFYKMVDAFARALTFGLMSVEMLMLLVSVPGLIVARRFLHKREMRQTGK